MYSDRVVIPPALQKRILKEFHVGHPGMSRMRSLMRSNVYWTNMDKDSKILQRLCFGGKGTSRKTQPQAKNLSCSGIHIDFDGPLDGFYYLIVVDSFSKWPEIFRCKKATAEVVTSFLHELFARFGVVDCIFSDNGSQFMSSELKKNLSNILSGTYHDHSVLSKK